MVKGVFSVVVVCTALLVGSWCWATEACNQAKMILADLDKGNVSPAARRAGLERALGLCPGNTTANILLGEDLLDEQSRTARERARDLFEEAVCNCDGDAQKAASYAGLSRTYAALELYRSAYAYMDKAAKYAQWVQKDARDPNRRLGARKDAAYSSLTGTYAELAGIYQRIADDSPMKSADLYGVFWLAAPDCSNAALSRAIMQSVSTSARIHFEYNSSILSEDGRIGVSELRDALDRIGGNNSVTLVGHTDERGTREYNQRLSVRRADSVRDYLVKNGIRAERITALGKGEDEPRRPEQTEDAYRVNRRVEIIVSPR